ncbi:MAG: hypothetical protein AAGG01_13130 [Planctomycetota bacterium]
MQNASREIPESESQEEHGGEGAPPPRNHKGLIDAIGWIGTALILGAYGLHSLEAIGNGALYQTMNLLGAIGVGVVCWRQRTWQAFFLELAWGVIAVVSLLRIAT